MGEKAHLSRILVRHSSVFFPFPSFTSHTRPSATHATPLGSSCVPHLSIACRLFRMERELLTDIHSALVLNGAVWYYRKKTQTQDIVHCERTQRDRRADKQAGTNMDHRQVYGIWKIIESKIELVVRTDKTAQPSQRQQRLLDTNVLGQGTVPLSRRVTVELEIFFEGGSVQVQELLQIPYVDESDVLRELAVLGGYCAVRIY